MVVCSGGLQCAAVLLFVCGSLQAVTITPLPYRGNEPGYRLPRGTATFLDREEGNRIRRVMLGDRGFAGFYGGSSSDKSRYDSSDGGDRHSGNEIDSDVYFDKRSREYYPNYNPDGGSRNTWDMKQRIQVFCDVVLCCRFVVIDISKEHSAFVVKNGGKTFCCNMRHHKSTNTVSRDRAPESSTIMLWKPQILETLHIIGQMAFLAAQDCFPRGEPYDNNGISSYNSAKSGYINRRGYDDNRHGIYNRNKVRGFEGHSRGYQPRYDTNRGGFVDMWGRGGYYGSSDKDDTVREGTVGFYGRSRRP